MCWPASFVQRGDWATAICTNCHGLTGNSSTDAVSNSTTDIQTSPNSSSTAQPPDGSNGDIVEQTNRPQWQAAQRSRDNIRNWVYELGGPLEDVT